MNEIDILVNAGLSRPTAEMVVALHTMAATVGEIMAGRQHVPEPPDQEAQTDEHV